VATIETVMSIFSTDILLVTHSLAPRDARSSLTMRDLLQLKARR
jgi:hypothetical protein